MNITDLIPQRAPILMVDDIRVETKDRIESTLKVTEDNWFCESDHMTEAGLVEHIAQSAAAMVGLQTEGVPKVGYVGDVRDMEIHRCVMVGEVLQSQIEVVTQIENVTMVEAECCVLPSRESIAHARMKVFVAE